MTTMRQIEEACALCGTLNHRMQLTSYNTFGGQDTEFRSFAIGFDPLVLAVHSCWCCGYTGYRINEGVPDTLRPRIEKLMSGLIAGKVPGHENVYVRMALLAELRSEGDEKEGELWLRAAWVADDLSKPSDANLFRTNAAKKLGDSLIKEAAAKKVFDYGVKCLRVAEIHRRKRDFLQASQWLDRAEQQNLPQQIVQQLPTLRQLVAEQDSRQVMWSK